MIDRFVEVADQGLALLAHETSARRLRLAGLRHAYAQLQRALQATLAELRREAEPSPTTAGRTGARKPKKVRER